MFMMLTCILIYVAAVCEHGSIRLEGANSSSTHRVVMCINGIWGTVCSDFLDNNDASVICTQLGYSPYGRWCESVSILLLKCIIFTKPSL